MTVKLKFDPEKHITSLVLIPLVVGLIALLLAAMVAVDRMHTASVKQNLEQMHIAVQHMFQQQIEGDAKQMASTLEMILTDQVLVDLIARQDRNSMLQRTMPIYKTLNKRYDITHFYITNPDRVNIMRAHEPKRFGDIINRHTTMEAARTGDLHWGIELGPMGLFTLRVVKPVFRTGKLIGFLELGREIHYLLPRIKSVLGVDVYATIYKQYVQRESWESGMRLMGREASWSRFADVVLVDSTAPIDASIQAILSKSRKNNSEHVVDKESSHAIYLMPLRDASDQEVGHLILRIDFAEMNQQARRMEMIMLPLGVAPGLVFLTLFYLLLNRLQKALSRSREALIKESQRRETLQEQHLQDMAAGRREIEEQATFLETVIHNAGDGIITIDSQGIVLSFNQAAEGIFGYGRDKVIGHNVSMLMPEHELSHHDGYLSAYLKTGAAGILGKGRDVQGARCDGSRIPIHLAVSEVEKMDGDRVFVGVIHDMSDRERAEQAMRERNLALERSNKELESFAYVASHDLQEPLRKVQAFGERLGRIAGDKLGEQGQDYLARIRNAAARMQMLINDLLQFSRVTTRALPFEPVDLKAIAESVICDLEVPLEEKGGHVHLGELPHLEADPMQMRQLFQNLIGNSLKYSRAGVPPEIRVEQVTGDHAPDRVTLAFSDNGFGFEMKYAERIFGLFQRLHGKNEYQGSGLGLALCRKIVERHGGEIHAESVPGHGSTFFVTLPMKPNADPLSISAREEEG